LPTTDDATDSESFIINYREMKKALCPPFALQILRQKTFSRKAHKGRRHGYFCRFEPSLSDFIGDFDDL
jgi:hypothetical protein